MLTIIESETFQSWLFELKDRKGRQRIIDRVARMADGNFGDNKSVGDNVREARCRFGPGYRLYYLRDGDTVVVLLCGGDKKTQTRDIARAKKLADERSWEDG